MSLARAALVDSDGRFGDRAIAYGLANRAAIDDATAAGGRLADVLVARGVLSTEERDWLARGGASGPLRYSIVRLLGEGGMGEVWKAWDRELHRWVALKFLHHDRPELVARLRREACAAAKLAHPNIVRVYDSTELEGRPCLAMEYVDGLPPEPPLPVRRALEILIPVADALAAAHARGIIHRDVKPANILLARDGRVLLGDFGLACDDAEISRLTRSGRLIGTPHYMAPEVVAGKRADERSDVYSLAATMYHLLTGRVLHCAKTSAELFGKILSEEPAPPDAPRDVRVVCMKGLEKEPRHRYASAADMARDLRATLSGDSIVASPPSTVRRLARWASRRPAILAAGVALVLAGVLFGGVRHHQRASARDRLERLLDDVRRGLSRPDRPAGAPTLDDLVIEGSSLRDNGCVARLAAALDDPDTRLFAIRVLARLDTPDAVQPLVRLLQDEPDEMLAAECAEALCRLRRAEAWPVLLAFRHRVGATSAAWLRTVPWLARLPAPVESTRADDARALLFRSHLRFERGDRDGALADADAAVSLEPGFARAYSVRALHRSARGDRDGARRDADRALELARPSERGHLFLARSLLRREHGDMAGAVDDASQAVALLPHAAPRAARATARRLAGDLDGALEDIVRALALQPSNPNLHVEHAAVLRSRNETSAALLAIDRALALQPSHGDALAERALVRIATGDLDAALRDASAAVDAAPRDGRYLLQRADVHRRRGDLRAAIRDCDAAILLDARQPMAHNTRGALRLEAGDVTGALDDLNRAVENEPHASRVWYNRGNARVRAGDMRGAIDDYDRALGLNPSGYSYVGRATARMAVGDIDGALADSDRAVAASPSYSGAWSNRGAVRRRAGFLDAAIADCSKAMELVPTDPWALLNRGLAYAALGNGTAARRDLQSCLALRPEPGLARDARAALERLGR